MYSQLILPIFDDAISSVVSVDGNTPCRSPAGRKTQKSGQDQSPASHSPLLASSVAPQMSGTCGQSSAGLSPSAVLQSCLASRLVANLDVNGSPEYELTWKSWDMPSGPPICRLRALARRTSGNDCGGWRTPTKSDGRGSSGKNREGRQIQLVDEVKATWPTPSARDWRDGRSNQHGKNSRPLNEVAMLSHGAEQNLSTAATESTGQLSVDFVRWLLGFPAEYLNCAPSAIRSYRSSRRSS